MTQRNVLLLEFGRRQQTQTNAHSADRKTLALKRRDRIPDISPMAYLILTGAGNGQLGKHEP